MPKTKPPENEMAAMLAPMMSVNPVFAKACADMMSEGARFMTERLRTDLETQKALLACRTPADLMEVQTDYVNTAMRDYAEEAARIMDMAMKASQDIVEDMKSGHSRGYDDVPV
jgi:hypothetical protein